MRTGLFNWVLIAITSTPLLSFTETYAQGLKETMEKNEFTYYLISEEMNKHETLDFSTSFMVDQSPKEVFNAITNVRAWWSENIEGGTGELNAEFLYKYQDVHRCRIKLVEVVPAKKVVWQVLENYFSFTKDKSEWTGTQIIFEISKEGNQTKLQFTHQGLVPEYECFEICSEGWTNYIDGSLKNLITSGKGTPNPKEGGFNQDLMEKWKLDSVSSISSDSIDRHFSVSFQVDKTPEEVFDAVTNIGGWWTENYKGNTRKLNDEFEVQFWDLHFSKQKLVEVIPNKRVVWQVIESKLTFIQKQDEWTDTRCIFDISRKGDQTEVLFTHEGLTPAMECFADCSTAWKEYLTESLRDFILTGKGKPETQVD